MDYIEWTDDVKVGVKIIDDQHKSMVDSVNILFNRIGDEKKQETGKIFSQMLDGIKIHFETEDKFMTESNYLDYISHKLEHERLYNKLNEINKNLIKGVSELTIEDLKSIKKWFFNHLEFKDKKLGKFINSLN